MNTLLSLVPDSLLSLIPNFAYGLKDLIFSDIPFEEKVMLISRTYKLTTLGDGMSSGYDVFDTVQTPYFDYAVIFFLIGIALTWLSRRWTIYQMLHPDDFPKLEDAKFGKLAFFIGWKNAWETPLNPGMSDEEVKWLLEEEMAYSIDAEDNIEGNFILESYYFVNSLKVPILTSLILPIWHFATRGMIIISILIVVALIKSAIAKFNSTKKDMTGATRAYRTRFTKKAIRARRSMYQ